MNTVDTETNGVKAGATVQSESQPQESWMKKLWRMRNLITVEPFFFCYVIPSYFMTVAIENLPLEKSCLVNLGNSKEICDNMIDKSINNISCQASAVEEMISNMTDTLLSSTENSPYELFLGNLTELVCQAERDSQKQVALVGSYKTIISTIFTLIIVVFAGGWSDRKGIRKPCMLFPLIGELLGCVILLIAAIFMDKIPMEFSEIGWAVVPAMFGGFSLMLIGIFSYLSCITSEENRTFRFVCFSISLSVVGIIAPLFAGVLYNSLGYIKLFLLCIVCYILGILHLVFVLDEVRPPAAAKNVEINGLDNAAFDGVVESQTNGSEPNKQSEERKKVSQDAAIPARKCNALLEFFDPTLVLECIKVLTRERDNCVRWIIYMCVICAFLSTGTSAEGGYFYEFARLQLNWDGQKYVQSLSFQNTVSIIGTLLTTHVLSKLMKVSDPLLGALSTILSIISRGLIAWASTSFLFYCGLTFDFLPAIKSIVLRSIISKNVDESELGKSLSIIDITGVLTGFVFPSFYSIIYRETLDTLRGTIFIVSGIIFIPVLFLYIMIHITEKRKRQLEYNKTITAPPDPFIESTYM